MYICVRFPHRHELAPRQYLAYSGVLERLENYFFLDLSPTNITNLHIYTKTILKPTEELNSTHWKQLHPVLSCPVPSHPVMSPPIPSCPVPSCPVLYCPIPSCSICVPSYLFLSFLVQYRHVLLHTIVSCPVLSGHTTLCLVSELAFRSYKHTYKTPQFNSNHNLLSVSSTNELKSIRSDIQIPSTLVKLILTPFQ